ncbi:MAG TPA: NAD(P)/FAD-dependent oxidoreductase [Streptosporangiaceae bacterium]
MIKGAAAGLFARANTTSDYARRTGCGIDEATEVVASAVGPTRRSVLGGVAVAAAAPLAERLSSGRVSSGHAPRVVVIGSGLAGLGCAYRLWRQHGIRSEVYEYNAARIGGRMHTLHGFFEAGQYAEQHGEFISSEHTAVRKLAASFGLTVDNVLSYRPGTHPLANRMRFGGRFWSQAELNREWHEWARALFLDAANNKAPWPTLYNHHTRWGRHWDRMPATEWIERNVPGGLGSNFGRLCVSVLLDEYGGAVEHESALNLIYLLGLYDSSAGGLQPRSHPELSGTDEKWHVRGGNDQLITGLARRLPRGLVHLGHRLVAVHHHGNGTYTVTLATGGSIRSVRADHVVLALPFTKLREVELTGVELPARQAQAIRYEPLGPNSKIQLQFSRRVWNAEHWTGNLYTDEIVQGGWETTIDQRPPHGIMIALPGGAVGEDIGRKYRLATFEGPAPQAMVRDYLRCFEASFPGISAAYNGKAYYSWSSGDPHVGGAYSYLKAGQYTSFNGIQGRRNGNLHFAGEHTSLDFQGYMEGALRTGYRCATEIAGR